jgi:hypothetical protein
LIRGKSLGWKGHLSQDPNPPFLIAHLRKGKKRRRKNGDKHLVRTHGGWHHPGVFLTWLREVARHCYSFLTNEEPEINSFSRSHST